MDKLTVNSPPPNFLVGCLMSLFQCRGYMASVGATVDELERNCKEAVVAQL
jgi:hypothetical protein